jgi:hypothetical protein
MINEYRGNEKKEKWKCFQTNGAVLTKAISLEITITKQ